MNSERNLDEGFSLDSQAYMKLLAYAGKAETEGYELTARLFRAAAGARKIYIDAYLQTPERVNSTAENLKSAIDREVYEADELYPGFIETARKGERPDVKRTLIRARSVKMKNIGLYEAALAELGNEPPADYYLCTVCGYLHKGREPVDCPVCGTGPKALERV